MSRGIWAAAKEQWEEGAVSASSALGPAGCRFVLGISAFHVDSLRLQGQGLSHSHPGNCDGSPQPSNGRHRWWVPEQFILGEGPLEGLQVGGLNGPIRRFLQGENRTLALCPRWAVVTLPEEFQFLSKIYLCSEVRSAKSFKKSFHMIIRKDANACTR